MPKNYPEVRDLGAKIDLLINSGATPIRSNDQLLKKLSTVKSKDYYSRLRNGVRPLSETILSEIAAAFDRPPKDFFDDLEHFGEKLGYSRKQIAQVKGQPLPGIEFSSRIRDSQAIANYRRLIAGYWATFYWSVSRTDAQLISRDLCIIHDDDEDGYIKCEVVDGHFRYVGWCFPIQSHLYFMLDKEELRNELIVYVTNLPDRKPPTLHGIILCLAGGVDDGNDYPSAAKIVFQYLGNDDDIRASRKLAPDADVRALLNQEVPCYLTAQELRPEERSILDHISNTVPPDAVPFALRMLKL